MRFLKRLRKGKTTEHRISKQDKNAANARCRGAKPAQRQGDDTQCDGIPELDDGKSDLPQLWPPSVQHFSLP